MYRLYCALCAVVTYWVDVVCFVLACCVFVCCVVFRLLGVACDCVVMVCRVVLCVALV